MGKAKNDGSSENLIWSSAHWLFTKMTTVRVIKFIMALNFIFIKLILHLAVKVFENLSCHSLITTFATEQTKWSRTAIKQGNLILCGTCYFVILDANGTLNR